MNDLERLTARTVRELAENVRVNEIEYAGLCLRERTEGRYAAEFCLDLSGVRSNRADAPKDQSLDRREWIENGLRTLFASLRAGQEMEFAHRWNTDLEGPSSIEWRIMGRCTTGVPCRALENARDLCRSLEAILNVAGLELARRGPERPGTSRPLAWSRVLTPRGIVVPCASGRPFGFAPDRAAEARVIVGTPRRSSGNARQPFSISEIRGSREVALSVRLSPVTLSTRAVSTLRSAHATLVSGPLDGVTFEEGGGGPVADETVLAALLHHLERWITDPRGYRVHCELEAPGPLPHVLTELVGSDVWDAPVSVRKSPMRRLMARGRRGYVLRLDQCVHRTEAPPEVVPRAERVRELGVPRVYKGTTAGFPTAGLLLGHSGPAKDSRPVRISESDRARHCYIIGGTGTGKSTLLRQMVVQDMQRGAGLCLLDPHGDLFEQTLQAIPPHREKDVILMDLTDFDHSVALNFLECAGPTKTLQMNFVVSELLTIFGRLYNMDLVGGPIFETYMRNALLTIMDNDGRPATLMDVVRFFENSGFRSSIIARCRNPIASGFWNDQALKVSGEGAFANMGPYITSKLSQFTASALIRPIIGQARNAIDFRRAMDGGQIILVNLAKGLLGELEMRLLGMLLVGKIVSAAMGRVTLSPHERRRFYLYIDEFQTLATPTVVGLLSEARKFGLSLIMANQHLAQLTEGKDSRGVAEAVLGNVATMLIFRVGNRDARELEAYTRPDLDAYDLQHLPDHHAVCRWVSNNVPAYPFVMQTLPISPMDQDRPRESELVRRIRQRARREFARPRQEVDAQIMRGWLENYATLEPSPE